jgi:hypothetical protein
MHELSQCSLGECGGLGFSRERGREEGGRERGRKRKGRERERDRERSVTVH